MKYIKYGTDIFISLLILSAMFSCIRFLAPADLPIEATDVLLGMVELGVETKVFLSIPTEVHLFLGVFFELLTHHRGP